MDVQLPDMDGVAALGRLRADPLTSSIAVIALTAFAMKEDRVRFIHAGFNGYMAKPIDIKTFPDQVRAFVDLAASQAAEGVDR
jgi:two-component system, cell cycle response regulator DivK